MGWWSILCAMAALNILAWLRTAATLARRRVDIPVEVYTARRRQLQLSTVYVFGCAFRSAFPVYDIPRIGVVDSWLSSVILGRSIATLAELCFVGQWALMLGETAKATGSRVAQIVSRALVPLIAIAECCSWYAVLTTSNLGHVAENSLWGLSAALVVIGLLATRSRAPSIQRPVLNAWYVAGIAYVAFIFLFDVPMYWSRWLADEASGRHYLSVAQGVLDVSTRRVVSHRWEDWKSEIAWMSLYFSAGVWISISLVQAPASPLPRARQTPR